MADITTDDMNLMYWYLSTGCPEKNDIGNYIFGEKSHLQKSYFYLFGRMHNLNLSQKIYVSVFLDHPLANPWATPS